MLSMALFKYGPHGLARGMLAFGYLSLAFQRSFSEFFSQHKKTSPEFGDGGRRLVVRSLMEASVGLWLNLPGVDNRQYYETAYDSAYGAYKSAGKCCRFKEKAERKSS